MLLAGRHFAGEEYRSGFTGESHRPDVRADLGRVAYVCFIVDAHSRMIVGWRVALHMRTTMVLDALEMARWSRGNLLEGLTCHSNVGSQFTPIRYGERLAEIGAVPSISSIGDSFDDALAETVNGYCKAELIYGPARSGPWKTVADVELATLSWVYWHNTSRLQPSSKPRSTMHNGPTNPWSKSNSPSLRQNQGDSKTWPRLWHSSPRLDRIAVVRLGCITGNAFRERAERLVKSGYGYYLLDLGLVDRAE